MRALHRGLACLAVTLAIWSLWPVFTRMSVTSTLEPDDIVFLRFTVSGILFLPILLVQRQSLPKSAWLWGAGFALCQGPLFVFVLALGLRLAPAGYGGALAPGVMPMFAALLGLLLFRERIARHRLLGLAAIALGAIVMASMGATRDVAVLAGSALLMLGALMAAVNVILMPRSGLTPIQAAALMCVYSMVAFVPFYLAFGHGRLLEAPIGEIAFQGVLQGVLMAGVSLVAYNSAVLLLGTLRASAALAITPIATMAAAIPILGEVPHWIEALGAAAIACGVALATGAAGPFMNGRSLLSARAALQSWLQDAVGPAARQEGAGRRAVAPQLKTPIIRLSHR